jgi:hypothetical protein
LPHDRTDDTERYSEPEYEETPDDSEGKEVPDEVERAAEEVADELERQEEVERAAEKAARDLDETESHHKEVEDAAERAAKELDEMEKEDDADCKESFEDELENDLDEVSDELHDEYATDMNRQLEGDSKKDSEAEEGGEEGSSSEKTESSESYEDAGTGMVYAMETKSENEPQSEGEVEKENQERSETSEPVDDVEDSPDGQSRNIITRQESQETKQEEFHSSESSEDPEKKGIRRPESSEQTEDTEPEVSKGETHQEESQEVCHSEPEESAVDDGLDSVEELDDSVVESELDYPHGVEESSEGMEESTESELDETEPETSEPEPSELTEQNEPSHEDDETIEREFDDEIPQEFVDRVEELVERLEESEGESEERLIVEALTGEPVVDKTLEPRSFFGEDEETSEEEEIRKQLRELFGELSREERERFKEIIRSRLESEKDLEELIRRHPSVRLSSDFKQKLRDAQSFVKGKKSGPATRLIRELWALEVERAWTKLVGESIRRSLEQSLKKALKRTAPKKKRKVKRKTGYHKNTEHSINLHRPLTGKRPVASFDRYKEWLERNFPGLCERSDYRTLLESVRKFFELRKALRRRKTIKHHELETLGRSLGIAPSTAIDWALHGQSPHLFQIVDSAFSKRDGLRLKTALLKKVGWVQDWPELERQLKGVYPGAAYKKISNYKDKKSRVKEFFVFLKYLVRGGTKKGIAKKSGISQRRVRAFFNQEIPWLLRHVLAKTGKLASSKRYSHHRSSTYKVKMRLLMVRGKVVGSFSEFKKLVNRDFPWLKERSDYQRLLHVVRVYFLAKRKFGKRANVTRSEIVEFEKRNNVSHQTVTEWLVGSSLPMVIEMLDRALSVSEARKELEGILKKLNGIVNLAEYQRRMKSFYLLDALKSLPNYMKEYELVKEFFRFLKALEKGGLYSDIITRGKLNMARTKHRRIEHMFPRLIGIASTIPDTPPQRGHRWIALEVKKGRPQRFIQVPLAIHRVSDLERVLDQLAPLNGRRMKEWKKRFGLIPRLTAFMYLLGALVSDGSFGRRNGISTPVSISLSTKYPWSESFGEAFCYCLDILGFKSGRIRNSTSKNQAGDDIEKMQWLSSASPFLFWLRNSLLGLKIDKTKSNQSIRADWILKMPRALIVPFLQGIADGDGYASVRGLNAGIGTKHNKEFFQLLLSVFGIDSLDGGTGIVITRKKSLENAANLPLFKYADGRLFRLQELKMMFASMKYTKVSDEERKRILEYHRQGVNSSQIGPLLYAEFGKARRSITIQKVINDAGS